MSSDEIQQSIDSAGISIIRDVLRYTGFQYEEPMGELDRTAARYAMRLYQEGNREAGELIAAISVWAENVSVARDQASAVEVTS